MRNTLAKPKAQRKKSPIDELASFRAFKALYGNDLTLEQCYQVVRVAQLHMDNQVAEDFIPHTPTDKQQEFLDCTAFEALYGGAAASGKTNALLHIAIRSAVAGSKVLVVRKTFADLNLPGAIMDRSHGWLENTSAHWSGMEKRWTFPERADGKPGGVIQFGYLDSAKDKFRYQGSEFQTLCVDELTQIEEESYLYLISRIRRTSDSLRPLEVRAATNPGGIGHDWVKKRFIDEPKGRVFIHATLKDNHHIDQESYTAALDMLDSITRAQLLFGIWIRNDGGQLFKYSKERNLIEHMPEPRQEHQGGRWLYYLGIDLGASESSPTTAFVVTAYHTKMPNLVVVVHGQAFAGMTPTSCAQEVMRLNGKFGFTKMVCDAGALGAGYVQEFRQRWALAVYPAQKRDKLAIRKLVNGELERKSIYVLDRDETRELRRELEELQWDEKGLDAAPGQPDHLTDAFLYSWREARSYAAKEDEHIPTDPAERGKWEERNMIEGIMKKAVMQNASEIKKLHMNAFGFSRSTEPDYDFE